ncbi:MAG: hypothetical protein ACREOY_03740, partial [Candidatus Dormibacteraceae bacterium]
ILERLPESHQAVVDGEIGFAHLATMARTAEALGDRFDERVLVHRHHWMVHEGGWQIVRVDGGKIVTIPPTVTFGSPRGPD